MNERDTIRDDVKKRGVTRLCHFTPSRKFLHIMTQTNALLPTLEVRERYPDLLDVTDQQRVDGRSDCVCCSIQYPNVWYFRKAQNMDELFKDWVIICLDPRLLWEREVVFSPRNAATQGGALQKPGLAGWQAMYQIEVQGAWGRVYTRRNLPEACPTDDQAEVLIPGAIPVHYVQAIIVPNSSQLCEEQARLSVLGIDVTFEWRIAPDLFTRECSDLLRRGIIPQEVVAPDRYGLLQG